MRTGKKPVVPYAWWCLGALLVLSWPALGALHVQSVLPGGAAEAAGVSAGDRLLRLAGRRLATMDDLRAVMAAHAPGDTVPLVVERGDEAVELSLTFGETPDGGTSFGVSLQVDAAGPGGTAGEEAGEATADCLEWIERTYHVDALLERFDLELDEERAALGACVVRDTSRMPPENARRYCDNVFKVHCSALDLLTEIGEAMVEDCESRLSASLGMPVGDEKSWRLCAEGAIFDRYVKKGEISDETACRAVWVQECGAEIGPAGEPASWRTWGGPEQEFRAPAGTLAESWPDEGPETLWSRVLGEGYSAILYEAGRLYTLFRSGDREVVVCLDAASGETIWERAYEQPLHERHLRNYGRGPNATPLLAGERLFTAGVAGTLHALDKRTGDILWSRELWGDELGGTFLLHGYSSSPMAHGNRVILPVGGEKAGLVAFEQATGEVAWTSPPMQNSYGSARLVEILGEEQIVAMMGDRVIGVDPSGGGLLWSHPHENQWKTNVTLPLVAAPDTVFVSSPQAGARGLKISRAGDGWQAEEIWSNRRIQFYHVSAARNGDWVYGSSGTTSPAFLSAVNILTGEIAWRERGFAKANTLAAAGKLIVLDEDGTLALARATPGSLQVLARAEILDRVAWTVPTLVGTTLYARDRSRIVALRLG